MKTVTFILNGNKTCVEVPDHELLVETLRERLGLTGTKPSCMEGECGACTVLLDGRNILSCLKLTVEVEGAHVTTIEGLAQGEALHPLQQSFIDAGAVQCGYCTPGMILASKALLEENPAPTDDQIARGLDGNLCRCTGYIKIIDAVRNAAARSDRDTKAGK
jgi:aerobic-type carbon monoxide dehydrogenase small subunit (CoxS/CutS family)